MANKPSNAGMETASSVSTTATTTPPAVRHRRASSPRRPSFSSAQSNGYVSSPSSPSLKERFETAEHSFQDALVILYHQLPPWLQDNHYILTGHRPQSSSYRKSIRSLTYLHNETVNIYTHGLGALFFSAVAFALYTVLYPRYPTASTADVLAFASFFAGAAACLGMSATYHTIANHSPAVAAFGNKLDYLGIVALIVGSFAGSMHYGFYCEPHLQRAYLAMILTLGAGCGAVSVITAFRTPVWRPYRAGMFVAMGLSAVVPVLHSLQRDGFERSNKQIGLGWVVNEGALYILGAGLYAARWPERAHPQRFDIWGSSHQIFHVLVLLAAASHLKGLLVAFDFNHRAGAPRC